MAFELSLTQALLATAAVVLAGVGLHGWWQMRRARPAQPRPRRAAAAAAATGDSEAGRVEPVLDPDTLLDPPDTRPAMLDLPAAPLRRSPRLDACIDALVPLSLEHPVTGEAVLLHMPGSRRAGSKPFYVEGLDADSGEWDSPQPGRRYSELQAGLQLANRSGPVNEIEYSEFVHKVQAFADAMAATPAFPDMLEVVDNARRLDAATNPLDAQLTLTLRTNGVAWSIGYIQQSAARHGFVTGSGLAAGRMVVPAEEEGAPPVLSLVIDPQLALAAAGLPGETEFDPQAGAVRSFLLCLDVPQTPQAAEPFVAWHLAATALADDMDATIVDDHGQPLPLAAFPTIAKELDDLYAQLEALEIPAGSPAARRLFS